MNHSLDATYWNERYLNDNFGWDTGSVTTPLKTYFDQLTNKEISILIPGAGNAYEAEYLVNAGFKNVFVCDLAPEPLKNLKKRCPAFKDENLLLIDFFEIGNSQASTTLSLTSTPEVSSGHVTPSLTSTPEINSGQVTLSQTNTELNQTTTELNRNGHTEQPALSLSKGSRITGHTERNRNGHTERSRSVTFDLIIEQTFFCALNPSLRQNYFKKVSQLLNPGGKLVGVLFNDPLNKDQPPFGGNKEEYLGYLDSSFKIKTFEPCYNSIKPRENRELFINLVRTV